MNFVEMNLQFIKIAGREKDKLKLDTPGEISAAISIFNKYKDSLFGISQAAILAAWGLTSHVSGGSTSSKMQITAQKNHAVQLAIADSKKNIVEKRENDSIDIRKYKMGAINNLPYCAWGVNWFCTRGQGAKENLFGLSDAEVGSSQKIKQKAIAGGCFRNRNNYMPKPGDIIVYTSKSNPSKGHVALVVSIDDKGGFDTVDPNSHETVERVHYSSIADAMYPKGADGRRTSELAGFVDMDAYYKKYPLKK